MTTHVSLARYEELESGAAAVRQPLSQFVRPLVEAGVKARKRPVLQLTIEQDGYLRQLAGMANNLNQLSKRAHQSGFAAVAQEVEAQAATLDRLLDYFADIGVGNGHAKEWEFAKTWRWPKRYGFRRRPPRLTDC